MLPKIYGKIRLKDGFILVPMLLKPMKGFIIIYIFHELLNYELLKLTYYQHIEPKSCPHGTISKHVNY